MLFEDINNNNFFSTTTTTTLKLKTTSSEFKYIIFLALKKLTYGKKNSGGRNFLGRVCIVGRGGGSKKRYVFVDFFRKINEYGVLMKILKDLNRTAYIGLILYKNGLTNFIVVSENSKVGDRIYSGKLNNNFFSTSTLNLKNCNSWFLPLNNINLFTNLYCLEVKPNKGSQLVRSAGNSAILIGKEKDLAIIKLTSGWQIKLDLNCFSSIGTVSNKENKFKILKKAGTKRNLGFRPKVRGVAKNPCDHPHGGGNGKKSPPSSPVTAWGKLVKTPTNNKKKDRLNRRLFKKII